MIDIQTYMLFIGAAFLLVIAPGPDMAYILARTVTQGRRAGITAAVGINVGAYVHVVASVIGLSAIFATSETAFVVVKWVGACYLFWIGARTLRASFASSGLNLDTNKRASYREIFWEGFLSDVLNPKVALFFLAFLPQFVDKRSVGAIATTQLLILGVTSNMVAIIVNIALVALASAATRTLRERSDVIKWLTRAAGVLFIALGVRLSLQSI
jgi:threonine/homoserine/homoserine lactone efflux protein